MANEYTSSQQHSSTQQARKNITELLQIKQCDDNGLVWFVAATCCRVKTRQQLHSLAAWGALNTAGRTLLNE